MSIYTLVNGSRYTIYEGMTQYQISAMWATLGWTGEVVDQVTFDAGVAAQPPKFVG